MQNAALASKPLASSSSPPPPPAPPPPSLRRSASPPLSWREEHHHPVVNVAQHLLSPLTATLAIVALHKAVTVAVTEDRSFKFGQQGRSTAAR